MAGQEPVTKTRMVREESYVYCLNHGDVHEDTLDPYGEGPGTCYNGEKGLRKSDVHRPVYWRARAGDWA